MSEVLEFSGTQLNAELYPILASDPTARRRLIENNLPLVRRRVDAFIRRVPSAAHLDDDLYSEGCLSLCNAIDSLSKQSHCENPTGYIRNAIDQDIVDVFDERELVSSTARTRQRERKNKPEPKSGVCVTCDSQTSNIYKTDDGVFCRDCHEKQIAREARESLDEDEFDCEVDCESSPEFTVGIEVLEEVFAVCPSELHREIISLRAEGYTQSAVADRLSLSQPTVCRMIDEVWEAYQERNND
jgi:RNA polymerase sigma factor (sigma-70 family)